MKKPLICALLGLGLATPLLQAQTAPAPTREARNNTAFNAQLFYQLLLGELSASQGDLGSAVSLMADAARRTGDGEIYQRATELALRARAGESALQVARSWRQAQPRSLDANRYVLQILLALNRIPETVEPLKSVIDLTPLPEREALLDMVPALYARTSDKKLATATAEQALAPMLSDARTAAAAWTAVGRLRAASGNAPGALDALQRAQAVDASHVPTALVAVELMDKRHSQAETLVRAYLEKTRPAAPQVRLNYARALLELQRTADSEHQLEILTREHPGVPEGWLLLGSLQQDAQRQAQAEASLERYLEVAGAQSPRNERGLAQAYLMLSQLAEKRGDMAAAERWLQRSDHPDLLVQAQSRRASLLARRGQMQEARELLRKLPEREPGDARAKLLAEVNLLREFKQYGPAHDLLEQASAQSPQDADLVYEQAMMAEKLERLDHMEQLLRRVIALKPDYHAAYNALGYSLADRGVRLQEARELILKALEFAPDDPFIQDSLAWVEFRLGNKAEARRVIEAAYKARPDAEIAAHFGEILWSLGEREKAQAIWREGQALNADNETLRDTLERLQGRRP